MTFLKATEEANKYYKILIKCFTLYKYKAYIKTCSRNTKLTLYNKGYHK